MAWIKGQSGNPSGRPKNRFLTESLIIALNEIDPETKDKRIRTLTQALAKLACGGDLPAIRECFDRLEGKAVQINENHNFNTNAADLSDEQLYSIIKHGRAEEGGEDDLPATTETPVH